jgi:hypothetical protein
MLSTNIYSSGDHGASSSSQYDFERRTREPGERLRFRPRQYIESMYPTRPRRQFDLNFVKNPGDFTDVLRGTTTKIATAITNWTGSRRTAPVDLLYIRILQLAGTEEELLRFAEELHREVHPGSKKLGEYLKGILSLNGRQVMYPVNDDRIAKSFHIPTIVSLKWYNESEENRINFNNWVETLRTWTPEIMYQEDSDYMITNEDQSGLELTSERRTRY